jgi:paraquat-inducible protein B
MSKPANPKLIGGFVLGAIALLVAGAVAFGGAKFFEKTHDYVMFFQGSVKGLRVGAPVSWRGVPIGQVKDIDLLYNPDKLKFYLQVIVEVVEGSATEIGRQETVVSPEEEIPLLIKKGLRGQLVQQSFVTGQLGVEFGFFPNTEPVLLGLNKKYQEVPTVPSTFQKIEVAVTSIVNRLEVIASKLEQVDISKMVADLEETVNAIRDIVASPGLKQAFINAEAAINDVRILVQDVDDRFRLFADNVDSAMSNANRTLQLAEGTFAEATKALKRADSFLGTASNVIQPGSPVHFELVSALREVAGAARSLKSLAETLERDPNALIFGRRGPGGQK